MKNWERVKALERFRKDWRGMSYIDHVPRYSLEELADFICEYIRDGARTSKRDVLDWFRWFERKHGRKKPLIRRRSRKVRIVICPAKPAKT